MVSGRPFIHSDQTGVLLLRVSQRPSGKPTLYQIGELCLTYYIHGSSIIRYRYKMRMISNTEARMLTLLHEWEGATLNTAELLRKVGLNPKQHMVALAVLVHTVESIGFDAHARLRFSTDYSMVAWLYTTGDVDHLLMLAKARENSDY